MAGFLVVDRKIRNVLIIGGVVAISLFILGVIIGHYSAPTGSSSNKQSSCSFQQALQASCPAEKFPPLGRRYLDWYAEQYKAGPCVSKKSQCKTFGQPKNYIAYHLNEKTIQIDGRLDDDAWKEVPWTDSFVDIRSNIFPKPRFETKVKLRWDDTKLYIGAYIEESDLWARYTVDDSPVWQDNSLEILMDVDGTMHNFKQVEINVLNTTYDLMYYQSPYDYGNWTGRSDNWTAGIQKAVFADGTVNVAGDVDKYWSVELSMTFAALSQNTSRKSAVVRDGETWFANFGRSVWKLNVTSDNRYVKTNDVEWWSWQPCGTVNLLLQDRWGLVSFRRDFANKDFDFKQWHIYKALFFVMDALEQEKALNGKYVDKIEELKVPPYLLSKKCVEIPQIRLVNRPTGPDFEVTVKSRIVSGLPGHIRSDRYVWFE